jgi:hypothetical protein
MLYRIVHGSSATSLNLIHEAARQDGAPRLFGRDTLYDTIVFKYPNFGSGRPRSGGRGGESGGERPVETGIYVPNDPRQPMEGGAGIYLRRPSHQQFLKEFFGIEVSGTNRKSSDPDLVKLMVIDDIPSLDPFLIKVRFDSLGIPLPPGAVRITESEEHETKALIRRRFMPILTKAFERAGGASDAQIERIVGSLWAPATPDSVMLMEAFGFAKEQAPATLFSFQGVCYYQHIFDITLGSLRIVTGWLSGPAERPSDLARLPKNDRDLYTMLHTEVDAALSSYLKEMDDIFFTFETAITFFNRRHNPYPLTMFLQNIGRYFWRIGHVLTSLLNAVSCIEDAYGQTATVPDLVTARETLMRLRTILSDTSEMTAI